MKFGYNPQRVGARPGEGDPEDGRGGPDDLWRSQKLAPDPDIEKKIEMEKKTKKP